MITVITIWLAPHSPARGARPRIMRLPRPPHGRRARPQTCRISGVDFGDGWRAGVAALDARTTFASGVAKPSKYGSSALDQLRAARLRPWMRQQPMIRHPLPRSEARVPRVRSAWKFRRIVRGSLRSAFGVPGPAAPRRDRRVRSARRASACRPGVHSGRIVRTCLLRPARVTTRRRRVKRETGRRLQGAVRHGLVRRRRRAEARCDAGRNHLRRVFAVLAQEMPAGLRRVRRGSAVADELLKGGQLLQHAGAREDRRGIRWVQGESVRRTCRRAEAYLARLRCTMMRRDLAPRRQFGSGAFGPSSISTICAAKARIRHGRSIV